MTTIKSAAMALNWKRGLFRVWVVGTCVWLMVGIYLAAEGLTAVRMPPGLNLYDCIANRTACPEWTAQPDWEARRRALIALIAPPIVLPALCFVLFWVGRAGLRAATWTVAGFKT